MNKIKEICKIELKRLREDLLHYENRLITIRAGIRIYKELLEKEGNNE